MQLPIRQQGRASLEFLGSLSGYTGGTLLKRARAQYDAQADASEVGPAFQEKVHYAQEIVGDSKEYRYDRLITRFVAENKERVSALALEPIAAEVEAEMARRDAEGGTLELNPDLDLPRYWSETEFHLTPGGWRGHPMLGTLLHEMVYPYIFLPGGVGAVKTGANLDTQRRSIAQQARKSSYRRILEPGSGTGRYLEALQQTFPDAQVVGVELSEPLLRYSHFLAAELGYSWELRQAPAEATGYPDASFDLVSIYTLLHEVPPQATNAIVGEAYRVLEPGGELVIGDVAPYSQQDPFQTLVMDWETENRNEPFWRGALLLDRVAILRGAGFVDVEEYAGGPGNYPWVTRAVKPGV